MRGWTQVPDEGLMTSCRGECPEKTEFSVEKWKVVLDGSMKEERIV